MHDKTIYETIYSRRSVRSFDSTPIPDEMLHRILESARWAPSGGNSQPWSFGIVRDDDKKRALAEAAGVLACCAPLQKPEAESEAGRKVNRLRWGDEIMAWLAECPGEYGASIVFRNGAPMIPGAHIQLAANAEGIGSCWIGFLDTERAGEILELPPHWRCYYLMPLGFPAQEPEARGRKSLQEMTFAESWGKRWRPVDEHPPLGKITIRDYREADAQDWLNLWGQIAVTSWAWQVLHHSKPRYQRESVELVAQANGRLVGFIDVEIEDEAGDLGYLKDEPCGFVWEFGVHPAYQKQGIGGRLLAAAEERLTPKGIKRMEFWSAEETSQSFYEHLGMEEMERHWQFFMKLPEHVREEMKRDGVGLFVAYGPAPMENFDEIKRKYRIKEDEQHKAKVCIGYDHRW